MHYILNLNIFSNIFIVRQEFFKLKKKGGEVF